MKTRPLISLTFLTNRLLFPAFPDVGSLTAFHSVWPCVSSHWEETLGLFGVWGWSPSSPNYSSNCVARDLSCWMAWLSSGHSNSRHLAQQPGVHLVDGGDWRGSFIFPLDRFYANQYWSVVGHLCRRPDPLFTLRVVEDQSFSSVGDSLLWKKISRLFLFSVPVFRSSSLAAVLVEFFFFL